MQLVAYMDGERVDATEMAHDPWRNLVNHTLYRDLVLLECGLRASRVTRRGRQFFKHYPDVECSIEHKSESPQHLAMKRALKDRINAVPGWSAEVEQAHPERAWIADVMATHTSGKRLAFEVQLSAQSEDEYVRRSQRYVDDHIGPVWVVPDNFDSFRVKLPMIITGFGKTSDLPGTPSALMDLAGYQPLLLNIGLVGRTVDAILHPSFSWRYGTPKYQLEDISNREKACAQAKAEDEARAAREAEEKHLAEQESTRKAIEEASRFAGSATAPDVRGVRPLLAGIRIWACAVRCLKSGHPMLIWRLTEPTPERAAAEPMWRPKSENFKNVRAHVDAWRAAAGNGLAKGEIRQVTGWPIRRTFICPECQEIIQGRWVSALPPAKWSVIAEASVARAQAREVLGRRTPAQSAPAEVKPQPVVQPVHITEGDWRFIGPKRRPYWTAEATDVREIVQRQAAKDAHAARMQQLRDNPRYRVHANGFRFDCTDCGGVFEDDKEGIHADAGCLVRNARSSSWP